MGDGQARAGFDIRTVMIFSRGMRELVRWYGEVLGLGDFQEYGEGHMGLRVGNTYLGIDQVDDWPQGSAGGVSARFDVPDLDATFERHVALGTEVRYAPATKPWGDRLASVYDPDRHLVGLVQRAS